MEAGVPGGKAPALVPAEAWLPLLWAGGGGARVSWEMALWGQALPIGGKGEHPRPAGPGVGMAGSDDCGSSWREPPGRRPQQRERRPQIHVQEGHCWPQRLSAPGAC